MSTEKISLELDALFSKEKAGMLVITDDMLTMITHERLMEFQDAILKGARERGITLVSIMESIPEGGVRIVWKTKEQS